MRVPTISPMRARRSIVGGLFLTDSTIHRGRVIRSLAARSRQRLISSSVKWMVTRLGRPLACRCRTLVVIVFCPSWGMLGRYLAVREPSVYLPRVGQVALLLSASALLAASRVPDRDRDPQPAHRATIATNAATRATTPPRPVCPIGSSYGAMIFTRTFHDQHAVTRMTAPTTASVAPPLLVLDPSNRNPTARTRLASGLTRMVARMVLQSRPNQAGVHTAAAIGSIPTVRTRIAERTHIIATMNSDANSITTRQIRPTALAPGIANSPARFAPRSVPFDASLMIQSENRSDTSISAAHTAMENAPR